MDRCRHRQEASLGLCGRRERAKLLSLKVLNDEAQILEVITVVGESWLIGCGRSTSSALRQRFWSRYWLGPASGCATPPGESWRR